MLADSQNGMHSYCLNKQLEGCYPSAETWARSLSVFRRSAHSHSFVEAASFWEGEHIHINHSVGAS